MLSIGRTTLVWLIWQAMLSCGMARLPDPLWDAAMPFVREE